MQSFKRHMARTKRGQPVSHRIPLSVLPASSQHVLILTRFAAVCHGQIMSNLMEDLLSKLRKQKQQNAAPKPRSSAPSAAS